MVNIFFGVCPCMKVLLLSPQGSHRIVKILAGLFYGFLLSVLFFKYIIVKIRLPLIWTLSLGLISTTYISVGCAFSLSMRCVTTLIIPSSLGKSGRAALRAVAVGFLLTGPIGNMLSNGEETVRTFTCTSSLVYNLTNTKYSLLVKPFTNAISNMKTDMREVKNALNSLQDVINPITEELLEDKELPYLIEENDYIDEIMGGTKHSDEIEKKYSTLLNGIKKFRGENSSDKTGEAVELKYFKKLEYKCNNALAAAVANCKRMFEESYDKCFETVNYLAAWFVCWPMKVNYICNIVEDMGGDKVCDPETVIPRGFGRGYVHLTEAINKLRKDNDKSYIQYSIVKPNISLERKTAMDVGLAIYQEFYEKMNIIVMLKQLFTIIILVVFINIIINAQNYHNQYAQDIEFNNCYVTDYFRLMDARRRAQNKYTLLPLKKTESPYLIDPTGLRRSKDETRSFTNQLFSFVPEVGTVSAIFIMDRLLYETLDLVRKHAKINYSQAGEDRMNIIVKGTGIVANLVRSLIQGFDFNQKLNLIQSNEACLPEPKLLPSLSLIQLGGIYAVLLVLILVNGYTSRLSRVFCAYFYPKREKKRIIYLYNETLKKRIRYYRYMKEKNLYKVTENKIEMDANFLLMLRLKYRCLNWLKLLKAARRVCLICREEEKIRSRPKGSHVCSTCQGYYCSECWSDASFTCYVCRPPVTGPLHHLSSDERSTSDDEDEEQ